jgi:hypothetical protein
MEISEQMLQSCKEFADNPISEGGFKWGKIRNVETAFELEGDLRMYISCTHVYHTGTFIVSCYPMVVDTMDLKAKTAREAANEAIEIVRSKAQMIVNSLTPKK